MDTENETTEKGRVTIVKLPGSRMLTSQLIASIRGASDVEGPRQSSSGMTYSEDSDLSDMAQRLHKDSTRYLHTGEETMYDDSEISELEVDSSAQRLFGESPDTERRLTNAPQESLGKRKTVYFSVVKPPPPDFSDENRSSLDSETSLATSEDGDGEEMQIGHPSGSTLTLEGESPDTERRLTNASHDSLGTRKSVYFSVVKPPPPDFSDENRGSLDSETSLATSENGDGEEMQVDHPSSPTLSPEGDDDEQDDSDSDDYVIVPVPAVRKSREERLWAPKFSSLTFSTLKYSLTGSETALARKGTGEVFFGMRSKQRMSVDSYDHHSELHRLASSQVRLAERLYEMKLPEEMKLPDERRPCFHTNHLNELEVVSIVTVLEDVLCELKILVRPDLEELRKKEYVFYRTIEERFAVPRLSEEVRLRDCGIVDDESYPALKERLRRESCKMLKILDATFQELLHDGNYTSLQDFVLVPRFVLQEELDMLLAARDRKLEVAMRKSDLRNYKIYLKEECDKIFEKKSKLKGYLKRYTYHLDKEMRYLQKWEKNRQSQLRYRIQREQNDVQKKREDAIYEEELDSYAHGRIMEYLSDDIQSLQKQIRTFERKEETDLDQFVVKLDKEIIGLRLLKKHLDEAKMASDALEERVQHEKYLKRRQEAALVIQGWWRFMMWLHGLPKKKTKKRKRKKKKGKKGKGGKKGKKGKK